MGLSGGSTVGVLEFCDRSLLIFLTVTLSYSLCKTDTMRGGLSLISLICVCSLLILHTHAQIFQNFFGGGQQQYEAREQEAPPSGDANWFEARVEAATCTQYLCPKTLSCVSSPANCPCPFPHQIRCPYPDTASGRMEGGGHVCVQERNCDSVLRARKVGQSFKWSQLTKA